MILAVDSALANLGWAIVRPGTGRVVDLGVSVTKPTKGADEWTDRGRRIAHQAKVLADLVERYDVRTIAAEGISIGGSLPVKYNMAVSLCLAWGMFAGVAEGMGCALVQVMAKQWQHAVTDSPTKINYDDLFARLCVFVGEQQGAALSTIDQDLRNHAVDAVGVGVYAALLSGTPISATDERRQLA